jgi:hypothetical protein
MHAKHPAAYVYELAARLVPQVMPHHMQPEASCSADST